MKSKLILFQAQLYILFNYFYAEAQIYECPNYVARFENSNNKFLVDSTDTPYQCNFTVLNPKVIINHYREKMENYIEPKPFASLGLRCSMCLAVAKEFHQIFRETTDNFKQSHKQTEAITSLGENILALCTHGFENHDLRKFKQYQTVSDDFKCSTHVHTKMNGKWTEKLRQICLLFSKHIDKHYLLNEYLKLEDDMAGYLCKSKGIFRDCSGLDVEEPTDSNQEITDLGELCN